MLIIDPMHNLYLGSARTIFHKVWMQQLSKAAILIRFLIRFSHLPSPTEYSLTAEQWMLWVNYFSIYYMHGIISDEELECWRPFILASRLLSSSCVSKENIWLADALLLSFCSRFECIYGSQAVKSNVHTHGHLTECDKDYGPLSSIWCFSFERFNGLLGDLPTNNCLIKIQIMQRFVNDNSYLQMLSYAPTESTEINAIFRDVIIDHAHSFQSMKHNFKSALQTSSMCSSGFTYYPARKHTLACFSSRGKYTFSSVSLTV